MSAFGQLLFLRRAEPSAHAETQHHQSHDHHQPPSTALSSAAAVTSGNSTMMTEDIITFDEDQVKDNVKYYASPAPFSSPAKSPMPSALPVHHDSTTTKVPVHMQTSIHDARPAESEYATASACSCSVFMDFSEDSGGDHEETVTLENALAALVDCDTEDEAMDVVSIDQGETHDSRKRKRSDSPDSAYSAVAIAGVADPGDAVSKICRCE